jgi:DNA polymerase-4
MNGGMLTIVEHLFISPVLKVVCPGVLAMSRTILHLDLDAFFCAVEEQRDPALCGKPFAVGGRPEERGVVASCSYAARRFGVHSAMPMAQARKRCPQLLIVPSHFAAYRAASAQVMERLRALTALVEQLSIDEAFLDVSDAGQPGALLAARLQSAIREELGLPCSLGVATNKLVAKIATDVGKASAQTGASPNALCVVPPGTEAAFLAPLPTRALWGVGPKTAERLAGMGIRTIGDLAGYPENELRRRFGKYGSELARHARGIDERAIQLTHVAKSLSKETTFARDVSSAETLHQTIRAQAAAVSQSLQRKGMSGTTVTLKLRWPDFTTLTRQATLSLPTNQEAMIEAVAVRLFTQVWQAGHPVRLLGVGVSGLGAGTSLWQPTLWECEPTPEEESKLLAGSTAAPPAARR